MLFSLYNVFSWNLNKNISYYNLPSKLIIGNNESNLNDKYYLVALNNFEVYYIIETLQFPLLLVTKPKKKRKKKTNFVFFNLFFN